MNKGERLRSSLQEALKGNEHVKEIRGLGLITGIQLDQVQCSPESSCRQSCWQMLVDGIEWQALVLSSAAVSVNRMGLLVQSWTRDTGSCVLDLMQEHLFMTAVHVMCSQQEVW